MASLEDEISRFLQAWMGVRQIVQAANFNQFHRAGLSATQFMVINVVPREGITLSSLARRLNLSPATLSKTVDSLEERGFLRRRKSKEDARRVDILATAEGERMQNAASGAFHEAMAILFTKMSGKDRSALVRGLEQLVQISQGSQDEEEGSSRRVGAAPQAVHSSERSRRS